jgi:hypothetical protein
MSRDMAPAKGRIGRPPGRNIITVGAGLRKDQWAYLRARTKAERRVSVNDTLRAVVDFSMLRVPVPQQQPEETVHARPAR